MARGPRPDLAPRRELSRVMSFRIALLGAAPDTGNLGVSALCESVLAGLSERVPDAEVVVFDHGQPVASPFDSHCRRLRLVTSRKIYRSSSIQNARIRARLAPLGVPRSEALAVLVESDLVLAIGAGDSFSDLYGGRVFGDIALPVETVIEHGACLALLPQTYGPFRSPSRRRRAEAIVRGASVAWARDPASFEVLRQLLGEDFDPERHRSGVDVAFGLQALDPRSESEACADLADWLSEAERAVALNVSGLLYNDPAARSKFGLSLDYRELVVSLCRRLLAREGLRLLLVPHVIPLRRSIESDLVACRAVAEQLDAPPERLRVAPGLRSPGQVKWLIAQTQWFCGTRMHSTIAALSSGVPAIAIAYSDKTAGVFETCGLADQIVDARRSEAEQALSKLLDSLECRDENRSRLLAQLPEVIEQQQQQLAHVLGALPHGTAAVR